MSLLTKLVEPLEGEEKIKVHQFVAGIREFQRGEVTQAQFFAFYELTAGEQAALAAWYTAEIVSGNLTTEEVEDVLLLGESGAYSVSKVQTRLNL